MIIGNGLFAKAFKKIDAENILFFCSGVSDSSEERYEEFKKEFDLLKKNITNKKLIYFSSISVCDNEDNRKYIKHKRNIEDFISHNSNDYLIFRLPQIIGKNGNKNNIINYFKNKLINQELIEVQKNSKRSIIDIEDVVQVVNKFINEKNKILNFSGFEILYASEILKFLITILNIENPKVSYIESKNNFIPINDIQIQNIITDFEINNYTFEILKKYLCY